MDGYRAVALWLVTISLVAAGGAGCPQLVQQYANPVPRALPPSPTLEQVVQVVNSNSSQIRSFRTNHATISGPGIPTLRASVAFERPRRFRLRAETALTGPELDLGSNDELFWFWVRRNRPPALHFCRHDQFAHSGARPAIAIAPEQLIEAFGLAEFDPALPHQGPFARTGGRLEIRTIREAAAGPTTKVTLIDAARGWIVEQHIYDPQGQLVVSAVASRHRRDPRSGLVMPKQVQIYCPAARFSMKIDLGNVEINSLEAARDELWKMPSYDGFPVVDLGTMGAVGAGLQ